MDDSGASAAPQLDDVLKGLLQFLSAAAKPGATASDDAFKAVLAASSPLSSKGDVEAALHAVAAVAPTTWSSALNQASPALRSSLHAQMLLLGEALHSSVPVYAQTATLLRLLLYRLLPSIVTLPEDEQYGTSEELARHFKSLQFLSGIIQPAEELPLVKDMGKKLKDAANKEAFVTAELEQAKSRMKQLGLSVTDKTANGAKDEEVLVNVLIEKKRVAPAKYKNFTIALAIIAAIMVILLLVFIIVFFTRNKRASVSKLSQISMQTAESFGSAPPASTSAFADVMGADLGLPRGDSRYVLSPEVGNALW